MVNIMQMATSRSKREHLTSQLSWAAAGLLVMHVWPVYLVDQFNEGSNEEKMGR